MLVSALHAFRILLVLTLYPTHHPWCTVQIYCVGNSSTVVYHIHVPTPYITGCTHLHHSVMSTIKRSSREGSCAWALRTVHSNTASLVFACMYIHVIRGWQTASAATVHGSVWLTGDPHVYCCIQALRVYIYIYILHQYSVRSCLLYYDTKNTTHSIHSMLLWYHVQDALPACAYHIS